MKVYRTVTVEELFSVTQSGWSYDGCTVHKQHVIVAFKPPLRDPTDAERQIRGYGLIQDPTVYSPGEINLFVVSRDADEINREEIAANQIAELQYQAQTTRVDLAKLAKERVDALSEIEKRDALEKQQRKALRDAESMKYKLESDIAKIRVAIGDLKLKEILGR